jgi:hypothetical protein
MGDRWVDRRAFLGLAGGGVGAMLAAPDAALAGLPRTSDAMLANTLRIEQAVLRHPAGLRADTASGWDIDKLVSQSVATMLWSIRSQRASKRERESPAFQQALAARMDGMLATVWAIALEFDGLEGDALRESEQAILEDEGLLDEARLVFTVNALENDMSNEAVERIDRAFERTIWRIKRRGLASVRDELLEKVETAAQRDGVDWRALAHQGATQPFAQAQFASFTDEDDLPWRVDNERRRPWDDGNAAHIMDRAHRQSTTGGWMLGIGILWMAGPQIIFGGICFGPPLIIAGVAKLVAAGNKRRRAEEILNETRQLR